MVDIQKAKQEPEMIRNELQYLYFERKERFKNEFEGLSLELMINQILIFDIEPEREVFNLRIIFNG